VFLYLQYSLFLGAVWLSELMIRTVDKSCDENDTNCRDYFTRTDKVIKQMWIWWAELVFWDIPICFGILICASRCPIDINGKSVTEVKKLVKQKDETKVPDDNEDDNELDETK